MSVMIGRQRLRATSRFGILIAP